ncbi:MAG: hypothetical protein LBJ10_04890 [Clostridiales bacterium]|jgi:endonuclease-3 related protein|nr:hypothetical protein [Clostridiales bacterium]
MLLSIYETLLAHCGELHWWPAMTPYEVIVGAVLSQNTAWGGDPAHDKTQNLKEEKALLDWLDGMSVKRLFA